MNVQRDGGTLVHSLDIQDAESCISIKTIFSAMEIPTPHAGAHLKYKDAVLPV